MVPAADIHISSEGDWLEGGAVLHIWGAMEKMESASGLGSSGSGFSSSRARKLVMPMFLFLVPVKNGQTCFLKHLECIFASHPGLGHGTVFQLYFVKSPLQTEQILEGSCCCP